MYCVSAVCFSVPDAAEADLKAVRAGYAGIAAYAPEKAGRIAIR